MQVKSLLLGVCVLTALIVGTAAADTLELINGHKLEGTLVGRKEGKVQFEVDGIVQTYNAADVKNISIASSTGQQPAKPVEKPSAAQTQSASPANISVPAGTVLMVRTSEPLDTGRHGNGHKFTAQLEADLVVNGSVVATKGSNVYGQISQAKQAGRLAGKSEMTLTFTGLMINNQIRPIQTGEIKAINQSGSGKNTAGKVARGAIIGGMIDGKDGARTGAQVGAGAALLTRGSRLNIPSGTLLEVPLAQAFAPN